MDLFEESTMVPGLEYAAAREIRQIDLARRSIRVPEPDLSPCSGFDLKRSDHQASPRRPSKRSSTLTNCGGCPGGLLASLRLWRHWEPVARTSTPLRVRPCDSASSGIPPSGNRVTPSCKLATLSQPGQQGEARARDRQAPRQSPHTLLHQPINSHNRNIQLAALTEQHPVPTRIEHGRTGRHGEAPNPHAVRIEQMQLLVR